MNFDNLTKSFSQTGQYEAAGTIWMLSTIPHSKDSETLTVDQLEKAGLSWTEEAFIASSTTPANRRFSFDVPGVVMASPLPMLAGRALVISWYDAMAVALTNKDEERVFRLFEAALSVPILLRLCPDDDSCQVASLSFCESLFAHSAASGADSFWQLAEKVVRLSGVAKAITEKRIAS